MIKSKDIKYISLQVATATVEIICQEASI